MTSGAPMNRCVVCGDVVLPGLPMASHIASKHPEVFEEVKQPYVLASIDEEDE